MLDFLHLPPWLLAQLTRWLDWLRAPLHTGPLDDVNPVDFWHGVLMGTAGAVLVPVAVLAARYWKIVPGQDWPRIINHRGWQRVHGHGSSQRCRNATAERGSGESEISGTYVSVS